MAKYDMEYMQEHCIDIYFRYGKRPFHVLTYGTTIPAPLNDVGRNRRIQHQVAVDVNGGMNSVEAHIERDYVSAVRESYGELASNSQLIPDEDTILQMFKPAAELGFYSYDCIEELEGGRGLYKLVAYPGVDVDVRSNVNLPVYDGLEIVEQDEEKDLIISFRM